ncbi:uncharacterized protein [Typha latifolia]|uniref:uncharacterized protein n=1 Tax=Typha latifolia TaxID=4733 RepID=UPI003C30E50F
MQEEKTHDRETHGMSGEIDEKTPINKVKAPNLLERAKEEIVALVDTIQSKKDQIHDIHEKKDEKEVKLPNPPEKAKGENEATMLKEKTHKKETHGTSNDIDENTPIDRIKAPNVFERAKEEIEAIVEAIHPKGPDHEPHSMKGGGFWESLGRFLDRFCSSMTMTGKRD